MSAFTSSVIADFATSLSPLGNSPIWSVSIARDSKGKTTTLQAIRFAYEICEAACQTQFSDGRYRINPQAVINRTTLNDNDAIWFDRSIQEPCEIVLGFTDGTTLEVSLQRGNACDVRCADVQIVDKFLAMNVEFVPPTGATSGLETWIPHTSFLASVNKGQHAEIWRNMMYWRYNDGDKKLFDQVVELVKRYVPVDQIHPPKLGHESPPSIAIEFEENGKPYDIGLSGAGMGWHAFNIQPCICVANE